MSTVDVALAVMGTVTVSVLGVWLGGRLDWHRPWCRCGSCRYRALLRESRRQAARDAADANGLRTLSDEHGIVWERTGTLVDVVDGLFMLPAPDMPGAPRRVKGSSSGLWTP